MRYPRSTGRSAYGRRPYVTRRRDPRNVYEMRYGVGWRDWFDPFMYSPVRAVGAIPAALKSHYNAYVESRKAERLAHEAREARWKEEQERLNREARAAKKQYDEENARIRHNAASVRMGYYGPIPSAPSMPMMYSSAPSMYPTMGNVVSPYAGGYQQDPEMAALLAKQAQQHRQTLLGRRKGIRWEPEVDVEPISQRSIQFTTSSGPRSEPQVYQSMTPRPSNVPFDYEEFMRTSRR